MSFFLPLDREESVFAFRLVPSEVTRIKLDSVSVRHVNLKTQAGQERDIFWTGFAASQMFSSILVFHFIQLSFTTVHAYFEYGLVCKRKIIAVNLLLII
jgi:hypothetical protein